MSGPLNGIRVLELASFGPGPHAAMLLADWGADVVRVDRLMPTTSVPGFEGRDTMLRGRTVVRADLKDPDDLAGVCGLIERADVLIEGLSARG